MTRGAGRINPIKNPSFEVNLTGYTAQTGGTVQTRDTSEFMFGTASMKCVTVSGAGRTAIYGATSGAGSNADSIPIVGYRPLITFSAYIKWTTTPNATTAKIHWYNSAGNWISDTDVTTTPTINTWTRLSATAQAPAAAVKYGLAISHGGTGTYFTDGWLAEESPIAGPYFDGSTTGVTGYTHYWDDAPHGSVSRAMATGVRTNLVLNPSFEGGSTANWTGDGGTLATGTFPPSTVAGSVVAHFGGSAYYLSSAIAATPGLSYTGSAWFTKSTTAARSNAVSVHFYDSGGTEIDAPTITVTALGVVDIPERRAASRVAPAGTVTVKVRATGNAGNNQVDAIMLEESPYLNSYFDGDTKSTTRTHAWTGTAHASTSTQTPPATTRINLIPNPSMEIGVTNWSNVTRSSAPASYPGAYAIGGFVGTWNASGGAAKSVGVYVVPGLDYAASAWCTKITTDPRSCAISLHFFDSAGAEIDAPSTTLTALAAQNVGERRSHIRTAPAGAVTAQVWYERDSTLQAFDAVLLEQSSSVGDYFDGSYAPAGFATQWLGVPHSSASILQTATTESMRVKMYEGGGWYPKQAIPRVRRSGLWKVPVPKRWDGAAWVELP